MAEKKIESETFAKAMAALQDIAKGHSSGGTATTKVEGFASMSGPTQLFHTAANSDPGSWAGSSWRGEGWEDSIDANGTDMGAPKALAKSIAKSIMAKLTKGEALSSRETNFVSKGGLNFLKDKDKDDEASKAFPPKDKDDEVEKAHPDAEEDKKQIESMVKPGAMKKSEVAKSMIDHAEDNDEVRKGFEVAPFLASWAQVMAKSLQSSEQRIIAQVTDRVLTAIARSDADNGAVQKSMAGAMASLGNVLAVQSQRLDQIETGPARAPKSQQINKSGMIPSPSDGGGGGLEGMTKSMVAERLLDMVKKSECTAQDVLKFDASGQLSPELARKVASR